MDQLVERRGNEWKDPELGKDQHSAETAHWVQYVVGR